MHLEKPVLNIQTSRQGYIVFGLYYLLSVPSVSSRYFEKIKRTSYLGKLPALSLEILCRANPVQFYNRD